MVTVQWVKSRVGWEGFGGRRVDRAGTGDAEAIVEAAARMRGVKVSPTQQ